MSLKNSSKKHLFPRHAGQTTPKRPSAKGVATLAEIARFVRAVRARGKKIVTTNGCFDLLHVGHIRYLEWAKRHGDVLIVGVNSDTSVRRLKGPTRPVTPQKERAEIVASLRAVDAAFIFNESTPKKWLAKLKPDVHVKGADRSMNEIIERDVVEKYGGCVLLAPHIKGRSTTSLLKRIKKQWFPKGAI
ncbi:D-glycero-beta-D-manno-heptose 1-phosphate adenylyltransferase [Candidatus Kaiserbacteria bacterium]|nr:D-glycero-beta-D-manno-heptose 1-phosphate adenylyltransferase [Candidatus Kaiserbacteria bacterium]